MEGIKVESRKEAGIESVQASWHCMLNAARSHAGTCLFGPRPLANGLLQIVGGKSNGPADANVCGHEIEHDG